MVAFSLENTRTNRYSLAIFVFGVFIFTIGLNPEFIGAQARFGLFLREMFCCGPSFFPTTYHTPYPDYPGTSTFMAYLIAKLFGRITPLVAILPSVIASALILVFTYQIGAIRSRKWGLYAVLFSLLTVEFFTDSRSMTMDQYVSIATVVSFYIVYSADCLGRPRRLGWLPLIWIFGFALRGPIGLVLPVATVIAYYLWSGWFKALILTVVSASVMLAIGMIGLLAAAKSQGGDSFMQAVLNTQMIGRIYDKGHGFTYYWLRCFSSYAMSYPLAILVVVCRFRDILQKKNADDKLLGSLATWVLIILAGMSIPTAKKMRYLLPLVPALSLISAYLLVCVSDQGLIRKVRKGFLRFCSLCPLFAAIAVLAIFLYARWFQPLWHAYFFSVFCLLVLLALFIRKGIERWKGWYDYDMMPMLIAVVVFAAVDIGIVDPLLYSLEKSRPFVRRVEALYEETPGTIVFFKVGPDAEDIKFAVNLSKPIEMRFVTSLDPLFCEPGTYYIIAKESVFRIMSANEKKQVQFLTRGKLGHREFVVFTLLKTLQGQHQVSFRREIDWTMILRECA